VGRPAVQRGQHRYRAGAAVVRAIVTAHSGKIDVRSEENRGARVFASCCHGSPRRRMNGGSDAGQLVTIRRGRCGHRRGPGLNLRLQGFRTESVGDGESARTRIEHGRPDLVLLDISFAQAERHLGAAATGARRATTCRDRAVSAARMNSTRWRVAMGADDYVTKPFALAELLARCGGPTPARAIAPDPPVAPAEARQRQQEGRDSLWDVAINLERARGAPGSPIKLTTRVSSCSHS